MSRNKRWIAFGVIAVVVIVIAIFASQSTKRAEYQSNDLVVSGDSTDPASVESIKFLQEAAEGTGINVIAIDPMKDPKSIPMTDAANMEVLGAALFFAADGDHSHEQLVHEEGYFSTLEEAQVLIQSILDGTAGHG